MNISRPPKQVDLETVLFTQPGYQPSYGRTSELEAVRKGYRKEELTFRLQKASLFLANSLMLGAKNTEDPAAAQFARKHAAISLLATSWHCFAEVRPGESRFPQRNVRRRALRLPDFTKTSIEERPNGSELQDEGSENIFECVIETNKIINVLRNNKSKPKDIARSKIEVGRTLGVAAVQIANIDIAKKWELQPGMSVLDTQVDLMLGYQQLIADSLALSDELENVPAFSMWSDPNGSQLQTYLKDTMPRPLVDRYHTVEKSLLKV